jgi:hypothetical protein
LLEGLPGFLRQGLFAEPRRYRGRAPRARAGELLSDSVVHAPRHGDQGVRRGEPKLAGHEGATTQDFVLATGPAFPQADAASFLLAMRALEAGTPMPEAVKQAMATAARAAQSAIKAVGGPDVANLEFFGHTPRHPLADRYYSQAALRYGDRIAKGAAFPASRELNALGDGPLDLRGDPDGFRAAVVEFFRRSPAEFDFRVQLCTDLERMPVEDASVRWPEEESSYLSVARLVLPRQEAYSPARQRYFDDVLAFRPAHSLEAHRPLGSAHARAAEDLRGAVRLPPRAQRGRRSASRAPSTRCRTSPLGGSISTAPATPAPAELRRGQPSLRALRGVLRARPEASVMAPPSTCVRTSATPGGARKGTGGLPRSAASITSRKMGAAFWPPVSPLPSVRGSSKPSHTATTMSGVKPTNQLSK